MILFDRFIKAFNILVGKKIYSDTFKRNDIHAFFNEIDKRFKAYLQVYIIKPDSLVDSQDTSFNKIDIYKHNDNISIEEKLLFHNAVNTYVQNYINSYYVVVNERVHGDHYQPLVFTVWYLGSEVRIGCFFNRDVIETIGIDSEKIKIKLESTLNIFNGISFKNKFNSMERNGFILMEQIIEKDHFSDQDFADYISSLFSNFSCNLIRYYFEESRKNTQFKKINERH